MAQRSDTGSQAALMDEQAILSAIIDNSDALIFSVDTKYCYTSFNSKHSSMMKNIYGSEIRTGKNMLDYMRVKEDREKAKKNLDRALAGEAFTESSYSGKIDLSRPYFDVTHAPIRNAAGVVIGVAVLAMDVTERKAVEEKTKQAEERYRVFVQNFPGIAYQGRMDFVPLFFHGAVEKITGYTESDFLAGKPRWDQLIYVEDLPRIMNEDTPKLRSIKTSIVREYRINHRNGDIKWVRENIQNICDDNGKPVLVQGSIYDITEHKLSEEELQKRMNELERYYKVSVGREDRILELKKQVKELKERLGEE